MNRAEQHSDALSPPSACAVRAGRALALAVAFVALAGRADGQAPPSGVNRPPTPVPAPGDAAPEPEPEAPDEEPEPGPEHLHVPAGPIVGSDEKPWVAWVGPSGAEAEGGNATLLMDRDGGDCFVVTTIEALGFRTGRRTVGLALHPDGPAGAGRENRVQAVSSYGFRALPAGEELSELCVLRLSREQARRLAGERALRFEFTHAMVEPWKPQDASLNAYCSHLTNGSKGLERSTVATPPASAGGAPMFWAIPGASGRMRRMLAGIVGQTVDGAPVLHAWHVLRPLLDEERTKPVDDARALEEFLRPATSWANRDALATAFKWSEECGFPLVAHWQTLPIGAGAESVEVDYRPGRLGTGKADRARTRMVSAVSDRPGDDVTLEIGNARFVGVERHSTPDAAVAIEDAGSFKDLRARILLQRPAGDAGARVIVVETARDSSGTPEFGRLPTASPAR